MALSDRPAPTNVDHGKALRAVKAPLRERAKRGIPPVAVSVVYSLLRPSSTASRFQLLAGTMVDEEHDNVSDRGWRR